MVLRAANSVIGKQFFELTRTASRRFPASPPESILTSVDQEISTLDSDFHTRVVMRPGAKETRYSSIRDSDLSKIETLARLSQQRQPISATWRLGRPVEEPSPIRIAGTLLEGVFCIEKRLGWPLFHLLPARTNGPISISWSHRSCLLKCGAN